MTMNHQFTLIDSAYRAFDKEFRKKHHHAVRDTEKGIWGASSCAVVFELFKKLNLDTRKSRKLKISGNLEKFKTFQSEQSFFVSQKSKNSDEILGHKNSSNFYKSTISEKKKKFLDIGCGDGRVVAVASLFTDAVGVEFDAELVREGNFIMKKINLSQAKLVQTDFFTHDFSQYDVLFINPDTGFYNGLEDKLIKEMRKDAVLLLYNNIFLPRFLKRGKTHWIDGVPVTEFFNHVD